MASVDERDEQQGRDATRRFARVGYALAAGAGLAAAVLAPDGLPLRAAAVALAAGAALAGWSNADRRPSRLTLRTHWGLLHRGHDHDPPAQDQVGDRLPARESLFAAIAADLERADAGVLGLISLLDFERLAAFDPPAADEMLAAVVDRARRMLGGRRLLAQVDRFRLAVWCGPDEDSETACAQLEALGYALGAPVQAGTREWLPEVRIATARVPAGGTTPHRLLSQAITASLPAGVTAAEPVADGAGAAEAAEAARERYAIEQDLRRAIERNQLELRFQPLIDAEARRVCGAEALLRWTHPAHGAVPPSRFIPIMESAGLADEIGLWVLNAACREVRNWQRRQLGALRIAVNISGHQLERSDLHALIARTLARHSLAADALEVELTETVAVGDAGRTAALFRQLRALGVAIAIDDFGTGYSSFSALRQLSFDKLKIDREFVTAVDQRRDSQAICRSMIALGQGLGIRVLAEGVERREEYAWLRRHGCSHFQGYYFAAPLDAAMFQAFVQDHGQLARRLGPPTLSRPERLRA